MKRKNIILCIAIAVCLSACIFVFLVKVAGVNMIKYEELQLNNLFIKYYGDFDGANTVKVYEGSIRRGTFELNVDKNILDKSNENPPYFHDLNGDGHDDILIPHSTDVNLAVRYAAFIWNNDTKMFEACKPLSDIANFSIDDSDILSSNMELKVTISPEEINVPEIYENHYVYLDCKLYEGNFVILREDTLIYYSENDIYCNTIKHYDTKSGEIIFEDEDWMTPEEAEEWIEDNK